MCVCTVGEPLEVRLRVVGRGTGRASLGERVDGASTDLFVRAGSGDREKQSELAVEVDQRRGLFRVGFMAHGNGFGSVVFALEERSLAAVAKVRDLRRPLGDVVDGLTLLAGA